MKTLAAKTLYPITIILEELIEVRTHTKPLATKTLYPITVILEEQQIEVHTQTKPLATKTLYPITVILEELIEVPRRNHWPLRHCII